MHKNSGANLNTINKVTIFRKKTIYISENWWYAKAKENSFGKCFLNKLNKKASIGNRILKYAKYLESDVVL